MDRDRAQVHAAIAARGLVSVMNETKWRELVTAVEERLPFAPAYQVKYVLAAEPDPASFDTDVWYSGGWSEGLIPSYAVEWIRVRPRRLKHRGRLVADEVEDIESAFLALLREIGVPHRKQGECIEIFGYTASTGGLER